MADDADAAAPAPNRHEATAPADGADPDGPNVTKSLATKIVELRDAVLLIRDSAKRVREGKRYYVLALASQLRGLIADQSRGSERLLIEVARQLGFSLDLYCMDDAIGLAEMMPDKDGLFITAGGFPVSAEQVHGGQRKTSLEDFLDFKIIKIRHKGYTVANVIKWYADKGGGTHYSKRIPKDFAEILNLGRKGPFNFDDMFVQIGEAIFSITQRMLASLINQELHLLLQMTELPSESMHILDALHKPADIRTTILVTPTSGLGFVFQGMNGDFIQIIENWNVVWNRIRHVHVSLSIDIEMLTVVEIYIDGELKFFRRFDICLITMCPDDGFDTLYNKKHFEDEPQKFEWFLALQMYYGTKLSAYKRAHTLLYIDQHRSDPEGSGMLIPSGTYIRSEPGNHDQAIEGRVEFIKFRDLKPGPTFDPQKAAN
jgi:hypothetical protein